MSIKVALAGNPNSGKTTLFNLLTGSNQFVGNWPGVTVEKKTGKFKNDKEIEITDLPGIYSLSPYTLEEVVSREFLLNEKVDVLINIVDGSNLERNLYLTTQLLELNIPTVLAVNMLDVVQKRGDIIDYNQLSKELGCPVISISALKKEGIDSLTQKVKELTNQKVNNHNIYDNDITETLNRIIDTLPSNLDENKKLFYAIKLFERDNKIKELIKVDNETLIKNLEIKLDDDSESIITNARYEYITSIIDDCYKRNVKEKLTTSDKIDKIVTNRFLALPIFAVIMYIVYFVSVTSVGTIVTDWTNDVLFGTIIPPAIEGLLNSINCVGWLQSLILDGIVGGVGAVLGFVPQMFVLFAFLAVLEDCGYMARVAFIMDRIFRKFGLSGKSFIPMLIGSGCGVPGIMASRTIENDRDRKMTIMTTTFIPCSAKLPIIALISGALFNKASWVAPSAYFLGVGAIIISGIILKKTKIFVGEPSPFVMEMPEYHLPRIINVLRSMWERGYSFIKKAGTVILLSTICIWFLQSFGFEGGTFKMVQDINNSLLASIGKLFAWIFTPLGWGDWKATVASMTGLVAKENVVGTFGQLYHFGEVGKNGNEIWTTLATSFTALSAYSFLAFNLLCAPCFAAMGAIKREMNNPKWTVFAITYQCVFAYVVALIIYQIGSFAITGIFTLGTLVALVLITLVIYLLFRPVKQSNQLDIDFSVK